MFSKKYSKYVKSLSGAVSPSTYTSGGESSFNLFTDSKNIHNFEPNKNQPEYQVRPSITDRARTIAQVCTTGTLCTTSSKSDIAGIPFGSYVDYILNEQGWPVVLLNQKAVHTQNIEMNDKVSLFIQLPKLPYGQTMAAVSRVTLMGSIRKISNNDALNALKFAFLLVHPHTEPIIESARFQFYEIIPTKIFFAGGFGVSSDWISVSDYEHAQPDIIANEVTTIMSRVNLEKQIELQLLCKHFLQVTEFDQIRIQSIDRLGIDVRIKNDNIVTEYRIGFRHTVNSPEDAKSELMKLFQEVWEREEGLCSFQDLPPIVKYAEERL